MSEDMTAGLESAIGEAQTQLRAMIEQSTAAARQEVTTAAEAVASRASELDAAQDALAVERAEVARQRDEAENARRDADALLEKATIRLETASSQSEAMLKDALERGRAIVATAEESAAQSRSRLRGLVAHIETFIRTVEPTPAFDLASELEIDLRASETDASTAAPTDESDPVHDEIADEAGMEAFFGDGADAPADSDVVPERAVSDAVRRAVRDWSSTRQQAG